MATFTLTSGADTVAGGAEDDTVNGTAATLNAGDSLTGGAGTDVLALFGSGDFRVDQLAVFTGFESITLNNFTNGFAYLYLGNQPAVVTGAGSGTDVVYLGSGATTFHGGNGQNVVSSDSAANWNAANVIDGSSQSTSTNITLNAGYTANATYDLTTNTLSHINTINGNGENLTVKVNSAAIGTANFQTLGTNGQLVTSDTTLDLSHSSVTGFTVWSSNATGTTFTIQDLGTAFQVAGGPGQDTIATQAFTFTAAQRDAIFATASVERIVDASGTYTAGPPNPNEFKLTTASDTIAGSAADDTVNGTAKTLNAGDRLTGGAGTDMLALYGSGTFHVDQLAVFTGFERIALNNFTNDTAILYLGNQPAAVTGAGSGAERVSLGSGATTFHGGSGQNIVFSVLGANWNAANVIDGSSQSTDIYLNTSNATNQTYDLTSNTLSHINYIIGAGDNLTVKVNSATAAATSKFAGSTNTQLVTSDTTLDLSPSSVTGFTVASSNATGTTFTVQDLGTAFQIAGGTGQDTIATQAFAFTAAQRDAIFATASVERIVDASGTYTAGPPDPNEFKLTTAPDTIAGSAADDTVNGTATTLNAGDRLTGGAGTDMLALYGSGTFHVDQLAVFTGFESIALNNFTNGIAALYLGNQPAVVTGAGSGSEAVYLGSGAITFHGGSGQNVVYSASAANWNAANVIDGSSQSTYISLNTNATANATYDLTPNTLSHIAYISGYGNNLTVKINSAAAGTSNFQAYGTNARLVTSDTTLDLSHSSVAGFAVASSNATGTTFTVQDLGTAFQIAGGAGLDTIATQAFTFTAAQRDAIFAASSIEVIQDPSGTYHLNDRNFAPAITSPAPADFNSDARADILWRNDNGAVALWTMSGAQKAADEVVSLIGNDWHLVGTADFNGDGKADILWRHDSGAVALWTMNGAQKVADQPVSNMGTDWKMADIADFNGDGKADILWRHDNGTVALWTMNGAQKVADQVISTIANDWKIADTADFNGDGKIDILLRHDSGAVAIWTMNGAQKVADQVVSNMGNDWHLIDTADFNGDGKADMLWRHDSGTIAVWTMNGAQKAADQVVSNIANDWHFVDTADFNGDGKADILLRHDNGAVAIWTMNGAQKAADQVVSNLGNDWHFLGLGDFNADHKADILWRHDTGAVALWTMNGAQKLADQIVSQMGHDWMLA